MAENDGTSGAVVEESPVIEINLDAPVEGTEAQKPEEPADAAEEQKAQESDEQKEARKQSRRSAARARDAAKLAEAQTETRMLRERLERFEKPVEATPEPKREDFDSLEDFHKALARSEAQKITKETIEADRKARSQQETQARTQETDKKVADAWTKGEEAFKKEAKDYDEVVGEFVESDLSDLDPTARRAILESDLGQRVLYHLAKNPDEAERIAQLSPTRQVIEIGKLEDKVNPPKKQSSAPAPVSGVKGSSVTHNITGNESQAEYEAKRKKMGARWAR